MTYDEAAKIALSLPGVTASTSYGQPAFKVGRRMLAAVKKDGETLVLKVGSLDEKEMLLEAEPDLFFTTPHYDGWPYVLAKLSEIAPLTLRSLLVASWRALAPPKLKREAEAAGTAP